MRTANSAAAALLVANALHLASTFQPAAAWRSSLQSKGGGHWTRTCANCRPMPHPHALRRSLRMLASESEEPKSTDEAMPATLEGADAPAAPSKDESATADRPKAVATPPKAAAPAVGSFSSIQDYFGSLNPFQYFEVTDGAASATKKPAPPAPKPAAAAPAPAPVVAKPVAESLPKEGEDASKVMSKEPETPKEEEAPVTAAAPAPVEAPPAAAAAEPKPAEVKEEKPAEKPVVQAMPPPPLVKPEEPKVTPAAKVDPPKPKVNVPPTELEVTKPATGDSATKAAAPKPAPKAVPSPSPAASTPSWFDSLGSFFGPSEKEPSAVSAKRPQEPPMPGSNLPPLDAAAVEKMLMEGGLNEVTLKETFRAMEEEAARQVASNRKSSAAAAAPPASAPVPAPSPPAAAAAAKQDKAVVVAPAASKKEALKPEAAPKEAQPNPLGGLLTGIFGSSSQAAAPAAPAAKKAPAPPAAAAAAAKAAAPSPSPEPKKTVADPPASKAAKPAEEANPLGGIFSGIFGASSVAQAPPKETAKKPAATSAQALTPAVAPPKAAAPAPAPKKAAPAPPKPSGGGGFFGGMFQEAVYDDEVGPKAPSSAKPLAPLPVETPMPVQAAVGKATAPAPPKQQPANPLAGFFGGLVSPPKPAPKPKEAAPKPEPVSAPAPAPKAAPAPGNVFGSLFSSVVAPKKAEPAKPTPPPPAAAPPAPSPALKAASGGGLFGGLFGAPQPAAKKAAAPAPPSPAAKGAVPPAAPKAAASKTVVPKMPSASSSSGGFFGGFLGAPAAPKPTPAAALPPPPAPASKAPAKKASGGDFFGGLFGGGASKAAASKEGPPKPAPPAVTPVAVGSRVQKMDDTFLRTVSTMLRRDQAKIKQFQTQTDRFRGGLLGPDAYYASVEALFGAQNVAAIVEPLAANLPEKDKRRALEAAYKKAKAAADAAAAAKPPAAPAPTKPVFKARVPMKPAAKAAPAPAPPAAAPAAPSPGPSPFGGMFGLGKGPAKAPSSASAGSGAGTGEQYPFAKAKLSPASYTLFVKRTDLYLRGGINARNYYDSLESLFGKGAMKEVVPAAAAALAKPKSALLLDVYRGMQQ